MNEASFLYTIPQELHQPLLSYLNLPPAGCFADHLEYYSPQDDQTYEIAKKHRELTIGERAKIGGTFSSINDLKTIHISAPGLLPSILNRLEDVNRYGNRVQPVWGGPESKRAFLQLLQNAERYIHISTYILGGSIGLEIVQTLAEKMCQGVEVRLLFCASGLVLSGSPSGTGFVSRFSDLRSYFTNDLYARKKILLELQRTGVPFLDSSPIGCHWRRLTLRQRGIKSERDYYTWTEKNGIPSEWVAEQHAIDRQSRIGFVNVDHRKMTIVDGDKAFIGSQNLSDSYLYSNKLSQDPAINRKNWQWHDASFILEGGGVHQLNDLFAQRWWLSGGDQFDYSAAFYKPKVVRKGNACVTTMATIPGNVQIPLKKNLAGFALTLLGGRRPLQMSGHNQVRERLRIFPDLATTKMVAEHCYPSDSELLQYWGQAAKSLKSFQMIVPKHYDVFFLGKECDSNYPGLISSGVQLFGYSPSILHTKIVSIDDFYTAIGSYNLNVRSSRADMECTFFVQCAEFGRQLQEKFESDLQQCEKVAPGKLADFRSQFSMPLIDALLRYFFF